MREKRWKVREKRWKVTEKRWKVREKRWKKREERHRHLSRGNKGEKKTDKDTDIPTKKSRD